MRKRSVDTGEKVPSRWQRFRQTVVWEYLQVIVVAFVIVFGFIRPFVVEAFEIPSGSLCLLVIASSSANLSMASISREQKLNSLTSINLHEETYLYSFPLTSKPSTSSNGSLPLEGIRLKRRGTHSMSMELQSKIVPIQNMCPLLLLISTISRPSANPIIYLMAMLLNPINFTQSIPLDVSRWQTL